MCYNWWFLDQLEYVDYFIGANGSFVWDNQNKKFLFKNTLNKDEVVKLYDSFSSEIKGFLITDFNKVYKSHKPL
ncbi:HAD hydrolase family protein [Mycoplasmopsis felis]|uniref:HAD hydrolase family protein n=1 Tax=Mycoplasmopsis felis TaxID=33923 RepID=UPI0028BEAD9A|nr:HAD hydrolase family protein [Mycoplasmopsis felis]